MFGAIRAPIKHCLQMDQNEIPHDPRHLGVPSGATKMISEPMACSAQTVHLSCVKISTVSKRTETALGLTPSTQVYSYNFLALDRLSTAAVSAFVKQIISW